MSSEHLISIALLIAGFLALGFGVRITFRARAMITFRSSQPTRPDFQLRLRDNPARMWGVCSAIIGLRMILVFLPVVLGFADASEASAGGWVTGIALFGLVLAAVWQGVTGFKDALNRPDVQKQLNNEEFDYEPQGDD